MLRDRENVAPGTCIRSVALLMACVALGFAAAGRADNGVGGWLSPTGNFWPMIPLHATLTPDGRVITYGSQSNGKQSGYFSYDVWDPAAGLSGGHLTLPNLTQTDIFCSAQVLLPSSGELFLAGGDNWTGTQTTNTGNDNTDLFDYRDNTLRRGNNMNRPRWYATTTTLVNGEIFVQGGRNGQDYPEVRDISGSFRLLTGAPTSTIGWFYPRNFVAPDGRVFGLDNLGNMYYVVTAGLGSLARAGKVSATYASENASAVMFRPGKILEFGGNWNGALVIDLTAMAPKVVNTAPLSSVRHWVTGTVLPDGRVLATGGSAVINKLTGVNNFAEIWDPATGVWTKGASGRTARLYHSMALLLPDASVLVGGGGAPGPLKNLNAEIYYPPYLYTSSGAFAARPSIDSAPDVLDIGQNFTMNVTAGGVSRVTLVKTGAVTHSFNMDQRFLELPFTGAGGELSVLAPTRSSDATPGYYLLFVIDAEGVPSVGKIIRINVQADSDPPSQPVNSVRSTAGGKPKISWEAATDNIAVAGYIILRSTNGAPMVEVTRIPGPPWTDKSAVAGISYVYQIEAYDLAGNVSLASSQLGSSLH